MSEYELNGEGFHYLVSYKRLREPNAPELKQAVRDWRQASLHAHTRDAFHAYVIFVQAVNNEGFAPVNQLQKYVAFSGEGSKYQTFLHYSSSSRCFGLLILNSFSAAPTDNLLLYSRPTLKFCRHFFSVNFNF